MGKGYSSGRIVCCLGKAEAEGKLINDSTVPEVARELSISETIVHRRKKLTTT